MAGCWWASKGHRCQRKSTLTPCFHLPSLLSLSASLAQPTEPYPQTRCPFTPASCRDLGNISATFCTGCLVTGKPWGSLRSRKSSPTSLGPALSRTATSMHLPHRSLRQAAPAPLPHEPPALPLLLPAWAPPPLPPLQQISLKCAAIWFQLSPIFFLVD